MHADGSVVGLDQVPRLTMNLGNNSQDGSSPCSTQAVLLTNLSTKMAATSNITTGLYQLRVLWQNYAGYGFSDCVKNLNALSSIDIAPENVIRNPTNSSYTLSLQVSFCLSNITILNSTLVSDGQLSCSSQPHMCLGQLGNTV